MPRPPKPTPFKTCRQCRSTLLRRRFKSGILEDLAQFKRRKFCDRACMATWMEGQMKVPSVRNSRRQSAKTVKPMCERCGRTGRLYVHHRDENPLNNADFNLKTLCGSCHRLSHSPNYMGIELQRKPCALCSRPAARKGLCNTHLTRLKRHGDPLAKKRKTALGWKLGKADS